MNNQIAFTISNEGVITVYVNNKALQPFGPDHPNYEEAKKALQEGDVESLERLADIPKAITTFSEGNVEVRDGVLYYENEALHNNLATRILHLMRENFPFQPFLNFLKNLMENSSCRAVDELFDFLDHQKLPITEDGMFLAYKRVKDDWTDFYTGKFDNHVGQKPKMRRNQVDDNRQMDCSRGFHAGTIEYVKHFNASSGHVVIVKINPKDVVSVPAHDTTKLRVCEYEVVGEYEEDLTKPLYDAGGKPYTLPNDPSDFEDDDDDDDDFEDWDDDDDDDDDDFEDWDDEDEDDDDDDDFEDWDDEDEDDDDDGTDPNSSTVVVMEEENTPPLPPMQ